MLIILIAIVYPTALTFLYFDLLANAPTVVQQGVYALGKVLQFGFPAVWTVSVLKEKIDVHRPSITDFVWGIGSGVIVLVAALLVVHLWLLPAGYFATAIDGIHAKIKGMGVDSPSRYIALSTFYALGHSGLEEYYWRWFVFGRLARRTSVSAAILWSSAGFMAHHVLIVGQFFGWSSPLTFALPPLVAIGGAGWAWLYHRTGSLYGPWISHLFVDAAIFFIGFELCFQGFG
jgi:membrane protease YdiL (CAAX protease family)